MPPRLVRETPDWQAWDKPEGYTVHNESPSMQEFFKTALPRADIHCLNRLDRETSGLVLVTTSAAPIARLQKVWQAESTQKVYVGIHRRPRDFKMQDQLWSQALTDKSEGRKNPQGLAKDRVACTTRFTPIAETEHLVLSLLTLESGRQHQIRKHSALNRLELIGDTRYGDPKYLERLKTHLSPLRLALHATFLQWCPQDTVEILCTEPPDFFRTVFPDVHTKVRDRIGTWVSGPLTLPK